MDLYYAGGIMIKYGIPDIYNKEKYEKFFALNPEVKDKHFMINYPPLIYALFSIVGKVPHPVVGNTWFVLNILFLLTTVVLIFYADPAENKGDKYRLLRFLLYGLFALLFTPTLRSLMLGQINLMLLLLMAGAYLVYKRDKPDIAGLLVGIATAIKILPGIVFIYFLVRKDWKAVSTGLITILIIHIGIAVIISPDLVSGYVTNTSGSHRSVGAIYEFIVPPNQSVPITIARIFSENPLNRPWINAPFLVKPLRILSAIFFFGILLFTMMKLNPKVKLKDEKTSPEINLISIDFLFPFCLCAQFVLSPLVWPHHQVFFLMAILITMEYIIRMKEMDRKTFFLSIFFVLVFWVIGTFNGTASSMTRPIAGYLRFVFMETLIPHFLVMIAWLMMAAMSFRYINKSDITES